LQSTVEELETTNQEVRKRSAQVDHANQFLDSVLNGLRGGVVVVDGDLRVQACNASTEELWGFRLDEVRGQHFLNLDIGLPVEQLRAPMRGCLIGDTNHEEVVLDATNRGGEPEFVPDVDEAALGLLAEDPDHMEMIRRLGLSSYIIVPLAARGHTIGATRHWRSPAASTTSRTWCSPKSLRSALPSGWTLPSSSKKLAPPCARGTKYLPWCRTTCATRCMP
jgi:hypothetical protein